MRGADQALVEGTRRRCIDAERHAARSRRRLALELAFRLDLGDLDGLSATAIWGLASTWEGRRTTPGVERPG